MFERFTTDARTVVAEAHVIARQTGSAMIDTRHVLIALAETDNTARTVLGEAGVDTATLGARLRHEVASGDLDADALASLGIDLNAVRRRADTVFGVGALDRAGHRSPSGHLPFAAEAKKSLELALREAVRLHSNSITANHLLLGLLRNTGCTAEESLRRSLVDTGLDVATLRSLIEQAEAQAS